MTWIATSECSIDVHESGLTLAGYFLVRLCIAHVVTDMCSIPWNLHWYFARTFTHLPHLDWESICKCFLPAISNSSSHRTSIHVDL